MERKRTILWDDPARYQKEVTTRFSGLDYLRAIRDGRVSPPPVSLLIGYNIHEVEKGYVVFELNPAEYHYNPFLSVHGGIISTLLDAAMTSSVLTTLKEGLSCSTIEIKVNFIRPVSIETGLIRCEAKPLNVGKRLATAGGQIKDKEGELLAHGTTTCSIFKVK